MASTLVEYLCALRQGEIVAKPEGESWDDLIARTAIPGRIAEIDEETYDYFLNVLPPFHMPRPPFCSGGFAFAEGAEPIRLFWLDRTHAQWFCRQLTWDETREYCRLAGIGVPC